VLVTRPAHDAPSWVTALEERGLEVQALPLIEIADAPDPVALATARDQVSAYGAVMFVSANAVNRFLGSNPVLAPGITAHPAIKIRAWATGPGTAEALRQAGWPADRIDTPAADAPQFDSEALWDLVQNQAQAPLRVLIVRGSDAHGRMAGRDWLATQLTAAGVQVNTVVAYARRLPAIGGDALGLARRAAADGTVWLFSSSEAVANLLALLPGQNWQAARAVATHARIARAARQAGFGTVRESRPALADVAASIESFA
jgi:uroporphyrinogen-III synthase